MFPYLHIWDNHSISGGAVVKNLPANAGDLGSISGAGRSPGEGNDNLLQYSCLKNSMNRGVWQVTIHRVPKSQTRLSARARAHTHTHTHVLGGGLKGMGRYTQSVAYSKGLWMLLLLLLLLLHYQGLCQNLFPFVTESGRARGQSDTEGIKTDSLTREWELGFSQ